jgi:hypothetical protein
MKVICVIKNSEQKTKGQVEVPSLFHIFYKARPTLKQKFLSNGEWKSTIFYVICCCAFYMNCRKESLSNERHIIIIVIFWKLKTETNEKLKKSKRKWKILYNENEENIKTEQKRELMNNNTFNNDIVITFWYNNFE